MMRRIIFIVSSVVGLGVIALFAAWLYVASEMDREIVPDGLDHYTVTIEEGQSTQSVIDMLVNRGFLPDANIVKIYLRLKPETVQSVHAGEYELLPGLSAKEVLQSLQGGAFQVQLTFLEGWRKEQFARYLINERGEEFGREFYDKTTSLEGVLFPDTYLVDATTSVDALINVLHETFEQKIAATDLENAVGTYTLNELVALASILEREVQTDTDRAIVAGILFKRLANGWRLETDATLQYSLADIATDKVGITTALTDPEFNWWPQVITVADLEIETEYNTRKYAGIPPTPICNPGLSSLEAIARPLQSEYWFYLTDAEGVTRFAATLEEHNANIQQFGVSGG